MNTIQNSKQPHVSVIMPVYNSERYLAEAIDSVLAQEGVRVELIVIDDGSTDSSPKIIKSYRDKIVLIGGWVPYFILMAAKFATGSRSKLWIKSSDWRVYSLS